MYITNYSCAVPQKKKQRHAVILQPVFGSKNCFVKPWSTRPPSCANRSYQNRSAFCWAKRGQRGQQLPFYRLPISYLIPGLVFGKPWMFQTPRMRRKKMSIPTLFLKRFFRTFLNHRKTKTQRKGACNIRHAKRALRLFSKEHLQNQQVLNTHKTWQFTQFLQANAFISTCFGNTPWHLKRRIQRKKNGKKCILPPQLQKSKSSIFPLYFQFHQPNLKKRQVPNFHGVFFHRLLTPTSKRLTTAKRPRSRCKRCSD